MAIDLTEESLNAPDASGEYDFDAPYVDGEHESFVKHCDEYTSEAGNRWVRFMLALQPTNGGVKGRLVTLLVPPSGKALGEIVRTLAPELVGRKGVEPSAFKGLPCRVEVTTKYSEFYGKDEPKITRVMPTAIRTPRAPAAAPSAGQPVTGPSACPQCQGWRRFADGSACGACKATGYRDGDVPF